MTRSGYRTGLLLTQPGWASARSASSPKSSPHRGAGSLDNLAADGDIYYSAEVQLGEVDASHGFRVFDYWARNVSASKARLTSPSWS
jgi:hypothetical protein